MDSGVRMLSASLVDPSIATNDVVDMRAFKFPESLIEIAEQTSTCVHGPGSSSFHKMGTCMRAAVEVIVLVVPVQNSHRVH